ncbi:hypothetical protein BKH42_01040 [Helicobacter sp. 13S00482-2]|uniref:DUF4006 family protein n=1 Tax=Helicobacter sp. 13S00482-2 TaxID=1476200 RepID=UPI000BA70368|nr:DUF4006 family protein [Helicobacter sp. 13S00482-2]PAF54524.1 hypothetical protein BKH42_01040 [Helicobacter sp. 13S00482-2]
MNGLFGINGLLGYIVAVLLVVGLAVGFGFAAVSIQKSQATNYYKIDNQANIKMKSKDNAYHYKAEH